MSGMLVGASVCNGFPARLQPSQSHQTSIAAICCRIRSPARLFTCGQSARFANGTFVPFVQARRVLELDRLVIRRDFYLLALGVLCCCVPRGAAYGLLKLKWLVLKVTLRTLITARTFLDNKRKMIENSKKSDKIAIGEDFGTQLLEMSFQFGDCFLLYISSEITLRVVSNKRC